MAHNVTHDSAVGIAMQQVKVTSSIVTGDLVRQGAKCGLVNHTPRESATLPGDFYSTIDTMARIRLEGVTGAFTEGQTVYASDAAKPTVSNATSTGALAIGFALRAKTAAAGDLFVQLIPTAG